MSENIDIRVREDGSREATARIRGLGQAADAAAASAAGLNQASQGAAGGMNAAGQAATGAAGAINNVANAAGNASQQLQNAGRSGGIFSTALGQFAVGATVFNALTEGVGGVVTKVKQLAEELFNAAKTLTEWQAGLDRFDIGIKQVSNDSEGAAANMEFVRNTVSRLGLDLNATGDSFVKFAAATKGTNMQGAETQKIFTAVAEAATVMHLNAQQVSMTFMALEQMVSKGTVSMEELRRQLGNHLPGAFEIAARSMDMTTQQLNDLVSSGKLLTEDFLPKFADQIRKEFGGSVEDASASAQASLNRLETAWLDLKRTVADSGLGKAAQGQLNILTDGINGVIEAMQRAKREGAGFWGQFGAGIAGAAGFLNPTQLLGYRAQSQQGMEQQLKTLQEQLKGVSPNDFYKSGQLKYEIGELQKQLAKAAASNPQTDPDAANPSAAMQDIMLQRAQDARVRAYVDGSGKGINHLTESERFKKELGDIQTQFDNATKGLDKSSAEYIEALNTFTARKNEAIENFNKKGKRASDRAFQNELSREITEYQGYADQRKVIMETELKESEDRRNKGLTNERQYILEQQRIRSDELTDLQAVAELQADVASGKKQTAARQKYLNEAARLAEEQVKLAADTQAKLSAIDKQTADSAWKALISLEEAGNTRNRQFRDQMDQLTQGSGTKELNARLKAVQDSADRSRTQLRQQAERTGSTESANYIVGLQKIADEEAKQMEQERANFEERQKWNADWHGGALQALNDYLDASKNVADQTKQMWSGAFKGMEDALTTFVTTGKLNFTNLVQSIMVDLTRLEVKILMSQVLQGLFSFLTPSNFSGAFNLGSAPTTSTIGGAPLMGLSGSMQPFDEGGYTGSGSKYQVKGYVHAEEFVVDSEATRGNRAALETLNKTGKLPATPIPFPVAAGGGGVNMSVQINNNVGDKASVSVQQGQDDNGNPNMVVMIDAIENELAGRVNSGRGPLLQAFTRKTGTSAKPGMQQG